MDISNFMKGNIDKTKNIPKLINSITIVPDSLGVTYYPEDSLSLSTVDTDEDQTDPLSLQ